MKTADLIVIDIETASAYPSFDEMEFIWQELWIEKVSKTLTIGTTVSELYHSRAGVMAEFSKIVCISMGWFDQPEHQVFRIKSLFGSDEKSILTDFLYELKKINSLNPNWIFAGHNIKEFDIPFICRRLIANNLQLPEYLDFQKMKPWETNIIDTFQYWRFGDYKNYTSLKLLANVMKVPSSKDDIDGSMVGPLYWETNPIQHEINLWRIAQYCSKDVITTANILLRFNNQKIMNPEKIIIEEIKST